MIALVAAFTGFRPAVLEFLSNLRANNNREWFQAHRAEYDELLLQPAREFVLAMHEPLKRLGEDVHAEPKVHGSIFSINRDTRFSPDKTPYKTYLDLWFWQGCRPSRESPGYFLRLAPESLSIGAGMHAFADSTLARYREAVLDDHRGQQLLDITNTIGTTPGGRTFKRVPQSFAVDHERADWLRHSGLYAEYTLEPVPPETFSEHFPTLCLEHFQRVAPLQRWLVDLLHA